MKLAKLHEEPADLLAEKPVAAKPAPKTPKPEVIELFIAKACKNPRFVIGDLNGFKAFVACPPKLSKNLVRKTVKVQVIRNGDETTYQYIP